MTTPLYQRLQQYINNEAISLHVPGHKNNTIGQLDKLDWSMDMTEITGLDDLHQPDDVLAQSMAGIHKHRDYQAYYLVNGTTSGILAVMQAFQHVKGDYLLARNAHKSVFNGLDLVEGQAELAATTVSTDTHQYVAPLFDQERLQNKRLAVVTYPNYYGETFDIASLVNDAHQSGVPVLVDEAHGAHFGLEGFPDSALQTGADFVVQSYHKTLPTLTMGSILFIHKDAPQKEAVERYLTYYQSSSPSYIVMASLELGHAFYQKFHDTHFTCKRNRLIAALRECGLVVTEVADPLKLVVCSRGYDGETLQRLFEEQEIYCELADDQQVLLILPLWHEGDTFPFEKLIERLRHIQIEARASETPVQDSMCLTRTHGYIASQRIEEVKAVRLEDSLGCVLAESLIPYPPGIPLMFKGEVVTTEMIEQLRQWSERQLRVEGLRHDTIRVKDE
ncbi:aminotransferase class V-fold PLP-dependent enzyme [Staphylococcus argensis]|uniref:Lysine decarboxylase n=1 Tax=Staphylococcus argensis TaxID=1607738 RepID=A0A2K4FBC2_9STAP|nr:aminotransferase class V-fold PLP-dependent enzyme [Staphylococcus argensis]MCY6992143.1 aminotransferase class V-fold PLP-dependent enzyme [Staphylococcus argensis]POA08668.1 lysine decarboxylase [Staphylococcus argensis]